MGKVIPGKNDLQTLHPNIASQWHPTLNAPTRPDSVASRSNKKYFWLCEKGHSYDATPDKRIAGEGCPYCNNRRLLVGYNDLATVYPNIAQEWDYTKNDGTPKDYTHRSTYKASWKCSICEYTWEAKISSRVDSKYQLCPKCSIAKRGEQKHKRALLNSGAITDPQLISEWDYERNTRGPEDYTPMSNENVYWICSKCTYQFKAKINNRTLRKSCACCAGKVVVQGINDLNTTHPNLAAEWHPNKNGDLSPTNVSHGMATKIWWICPEGHEYTASLLHRSAGTNCPICNSGRQTSFAEQAVYFYIKKLFPDALNRYNELFSNSMELDIYIPSIKLAIEYDGMAWHKSDKLEREKRKYKLCKEKGIKLIRLMEKPPEGGILLTADESLTILDGNMYEKKHLEKCIRMLLDKLDPESNMWTRNKAVFRNTIDINIERDEAEIRKFMTNLRNGSFAEMYPELAKEWHPTKNGDLTPEKIKPHSSIRIWWKCKDCTTDYCTTASHRVYGTGCPKCGIEKNAKSRRKAIVMIDPSSLKELKTFNSISAASKETGINPSNISTVCKKKRPTAGGYIWRYLDN